MGEIIKIDTIKLKRGTQVALETVLRGDKKPQLAEIIFEVPSAAHPDGRIKIGDGINNYVDLNYLPDSIDLNAIMIETQNYANQAQEAASDAVASAAKAEQAMGRAELAAEFAGTIPNTATQQVSEYVNKKLHFMSMAEYNALTELDPNGFYFVTIED